MEKEYGGEEIITKQQSETKIKQEFQTFFSELKKEINESQQEINKQDIIALFNGSYGRDLRENKDQSHIKNSEDFKINLERVYNYIIQKCNSKDPSFYKKIQEHEKIYLKESELTSKNIYYKKLMILNIYLVKHFGVFFAYNTKHLPATPDPVIPAEKKQAPKEQQIIIQDFMSSLGFKTEEKPIEYILVEGKLPDTSIQGMYIADNIFIFQNKDNNSEDTIYQDLSHEYFHSCFDQKYGKYIKLEDTIKKGNKDYQIGSINDGIFLHESRYSTTGLSAQELIADATEMKLRGGKNQIDLRHKAYNLKEHKTCPVKYRNSIWLMTSIINNTPEIKNIYEEYVNNLKTIGEKKSDEMLEQKLKITKDGISYQEYITNKFYIKAQELIQILNDFIKEKQ